MSCGGKEGPSHLVQLLFTPIPPHARRLPGSICSQAAHKVSVKCWDAPCVWKGGCEEGGREGSAGCPDTPHEYRPGRALWSYSGRGLPLLQATTPPSPISSASFPPSSKTPAQGLIPSCCRTSRVWDTPLRRRKRRRRTRCKGAGCCGSVS